MRVSQSRSQLARKEPAQQACTIIFDVPAFEVPMAVNTAIEGRRKPRIVVQTYAGGCSV